MHRGDCVQRHPPGVPASLIDVREASDANLSAVEDSDADLAFLEEDDNFVPRFDFLRSIG